ncbi:MAG: hypothetical protein F6J87_22490 [Spirulina sp. SIO3F2]|nr:hypothetical protein [Spirulina sp. SIO3F2]
MMIQYQVGGSLASQASSYINRQADADLYDRLKNGELCYVFNARQMGKSSLLVRTMARLQEDGYRCSVVDITNIGSENITPLQWYKGMMYDLCCGFDFFQDISLRSWQKGQGEFSLLQQLSHFLETVLLPQFPNEHLVVFIDEIDSILSLPFAVDDFFALIRYCYNRRTVNPIYNRLTFALFGVATPSDLIQDVRRTPFNIGCPINLSGFSVAEAQPLSQGFELKEGNPKSVLSVILDWTNGQPFLTQKLCQMVVNVTVDQTVSISPDTEAFWVENLVSDRLLTNWQSNDEPEHLRTIRNRILHSDQKAGRLLGIYQQVLSGETVQTDDSPEQTNLFLSGLVIKQGGVLRVKNRIYAAVFNLDWVNQQLENLRPYASLLTAWSASEQQDESRLLRGQALQDAQAWALGKQLSDLDYQYLAASAESDRRAQAQAKEAEYLQAQLIQQQRAAKLQRRFLGAVSGALLLAIGLGSFTFWQYRQALRSEIKALISASNGNRASHQRLWSTLDAIKAYQEAHKLYPADSELQEQTLVTLRQAIYTAQEFNQVALTTTPREVAVQPNGNILAFGGNDGQLYLMHPDGRISSTIPAYESEIKKIAFSPDGQLIAATATNQVKVWQLDGTLVHQFDVPSAVSTVHFSPDGQYLAVSEERAALLHLWRMDGTYSMTLPSTLGFHFSPDGQWLATGDVDSVQLWRWPLPGKNAPVPIRTIPIGGEQAQRRPADKPKDVREILFSPDSQKLAITDGYLSVELRQLDGQLLTRIPRPMTLSANLTFTADSQQLVTVSEGKVIDFWNLDGTLAHSLRGHRATISAVAIAPDRQHLITTDSEGVIRFWQWRLPFVQRLGLSTDAHPNAVLDPKGTTLAAIPTIPTQAQLHIWQRQPQQAFAPRSNIAAAAGHRLPIHKIAISADAKVLASVSRGGNIKIWTAQGQLLQELNSGVNIWDVAFSPDGQAIATALANGQIHLWHKNAQGQFHSIPKKIQAHQAAVRQVNFSPDGQQLVSGSVDQTIKIWQFSDQRLLQTLEGHTASVYAVSFSPDGQRLVSGSSDRTLRLWHTDGTLLKTVFAHQGDVRASAFSADGNYIFTASRDGTAKIWDYRNQTLQEKALRNLSNQELELMDLSVSTNGQTLVVTGIGSSIMVWSLEDVLAVDELAYACNWVKDYLAYHAPREDRELCNGVSGQDPQ